MNDIYKTRELALFQIENDVYGIDIEHIQEINKNLAFTTVYKAADYVKGVLNLRGQIVTVIDLRVKFNYTESKMHLGNRVIILKFKSESVGLLVDKMEDIVEVNPANLDNNAAQIEGVDHNYFSGVYKMDDKLVILLDIEQILRETESSAAIA